MHLPPRRKRGHRHGHARTKAVDGGNPRHRSVLRDRRPADGRAAIDRVGMRPRRAGTRAPLRLGTGRAQPQLGRGTAETRPPRRAGRRRRAQSISMSVRLVFNSVWRNPGNRGRRFGRLGRAVRWQVRKCVARTAKVIQLANGMRFKAYPDCVVSSALVYSEWPEYWELGFVRQFLLSGEAIIDVGADVVHLP